MDGHRPTRRLTAVLAGATLGIAALAGCGGHGADRPSAAPSSGAGPGQTAARSTSDTATSTSASTWSPPHLPVIVTFKRVIGVDPLSSFLNVYSNGEGTATVVYGGTDGGKVHHFDLSQTQLRRLKRLLQRTRLPEQAVNDTGVYVYWVITPNSAHRLQEGTVPRSARPLLGALNAIADANHLF